MHAELVMVGNHVGDISWLLSCCLGDYLFMTIKFNTMVDKTKQYIILFYFVFHIAKADKTGLRFHAY